MGYNPIINWRSQGTHIAQSLNWPTEKYMDATNIQHFKESDNHELSGFFILK